MAFTWTPEDAHEFAKWEEQYLRRKKVKFKGTEGSGSIVSRRSPKWLALGMKERVE